MVSPQLSLLIILTMQSYKFYLKTTTTMQQQHIYLYMTAGSGTYRQNGCHFVTAVTYHISSHSHIGIKGAVLPLPNYVGPPNTRISQNPFLNSRKFVLNDTNRASSPPPSVRHFVTVGTKCDG